MRMSTIGDCVSFEPGPGFPCSSVDVPATELDFCRRKVLRIGHSRLAGTELLNILIPDARASKG